MMQGTSPWDDYISRLLRAKLDWEEKVPCRRLGPQLMYPASESKQQLIVRQVCSTCHAQAECLELALATEEQYGVWGGTTEIYRRTIFKLLSTVSDVKKTERIRAVVVEITKGHTSDSKVASA